MYVYVYIYIYMHIHTYTRIYQQHCILHVVYHVARMRAPRGEHNHSSFDRSDSARGNKCLQGPLSIGEKHTTALLLN